PPIGSPLPGGVTSLRVICSPASSVAGTVSGESALVLVVSPLLAGASTRAYQLCPWLALGASLTLVWHAPVTPVLSPASRPHRIPSLSVVHTLPSGRRIAAPPDSSPPKATDASNRPGTKYLNPTGTSPSFRPSEATTRSIRAEDTSVLPTAAPPGQLL